MSTLRSLFGSDPSALATGTKERARKAARRRAEREAIEARREPRVIAHRRLDDGTTVTVYADGSEVRS